MRQTIQVGGTGRGVNEVEGLTEDMFLEDGDVFVLDAFTDAAAQHAIPGWKEDVTVFERDTFVFRSATLDDYFRLDDGEENSQRLAPRRGAGW